MGMIKRLTRRQVLKGAVMGSAVTVALPLLECFLNTNGTALASGAPLPTRFASWFWGLGFNPGRWEPQREGSLMDQPLGPEMVALEPLKDKINIYSKLKMPLDGKPNLPHISGWMGQLTGTAPLTDTMSLPTFNTIISEAIGGTSRFRSLEVSCTGNPRDTLSYNAGGVQLTGEVSPAQLYARIFGPEFRDPNSAEFKPDPVLLLNRSVLSFVEDQRHSLVKDLGSADRARLDEYFTSLRQLERQIDIQVEKPAPCESCTVPAKIDDAPVGTLLEVSLQTNKLMSGLLAHALACNQTRVVNILFSTPASGLRLPGDATTHHTYSHQESFDRELGYQKQVSYFNTRSMEGFATLIQTLASIQEGDGTLLDHTLVMASTDVGFANTHATQNIPAITAGRANGAMKTGLHMQAVGDNSTRVGLTVMQALGVPVPAFGTGANEATRSFSEVLVHA